MNNNIPKRNKCNRHPARNTPWSVNKTKGNLRQRIRQTLRQAIPREEAAPPDTQNHPKQR